jgi:hypothetical protein
MSELLDLSVDSNPITQKFILVKSDTLNLAFPIVQVHEVLFKAAVVKQKNNSITEYREHVIPVLFGQRACPEMPEVALVLLRSAKIKGGLLAIACSVLPRMVEIARQDWIKVPALPAPWRSDRKGYEFEQIIYTFTSGIGKG